MVQAAYGYRGEGIYSRSGTPLPINSDTQPLIHGVRKMGNEDKYFEKKSVDYVFRAPRSAYGIGVYYLTAFPFNV